MKSEYVELDNVYYGHLKPLTIKDGVELSNFWKDFQFNTDWSADIKESDKLIIDWDNYDVSWVSVQDGITFSRLLCIVRKW